MRVYLDVCCLNRPFDDQSQDKVRLEAEAIISILKRCEYSGWKLTGSDIIRLEIAKTKDHVKRQKILLLYEGITEEIKYNAVIKDRAAQLRELGASLFDSLHLASVGMALFMRQYEKGYGNYTEERNELLKDMTVEDIEHELKTMR